MLHNKKEKGNYQLPRPPVRATTANSDNINQRADRARTPQAGTQTAGRQPQVNKTEDELLPGAFSPHTYRTPTKSIGFSSEENLNRVETAGHYGWPVATLNNSNSTPRPPGKRAEQGWRRKSRLLSTGFPARQGRLRGNFSRGKDKNVPRNQRLAGSGRVVQAASHIVYRRRARSVNPPIPDRRLRSGS